MPHISETSGILQGKHPSFPHCPKHLPEYPDVLSLRIRIPVLISIIIDKIPGGKEGLCITQHHAKLMELLSRQEKLYPRIRKDCRKPSFLQCGPWSCGPIRKHRFPHPLTLSILSGSRKKRPLPGNKLCWNHQCALRKSMFRDDLPDSLFGNSAIHRLLENQRNRAEVSAVHLMKQHPPHLLHTFAASLRGPHKTALPAHRKNSQAG